MGPAVTAVQPVVILDALPAAMSVVRLDAPRAVIPDVRATAASSAQAKSSVRYVIPSSAMGRANVDGMMMNWAMNGGTRIKREIASMILLDVVREKTIRWGEMGVTGQVSSTREEADWGETNLLE